MLKITNLNKSFGSKNVLKNISFSAPAGKITGFIGKMVQEKRQPSILF